MPRTRKTPAQKLAVGKAFLKYLEETKQGADFGKSELTEIFNNDYRPSHPAICRGFNCSAVLFTLRINGMVKYKNEQVRVTPGYLARDQYSTLRLHELGVSNKGASSRHPFYCADCDVKGNSLKSFRGHLMGKKHLQQMSLKYLKDRREVMISNRNSVKVTSDYDDSDGTISFSMNIDSTHTFLLKVANTSDTAQVGFLACLILKVQPGITLHDLPGDLILQPGTQCSIKVLVKADCIGVLQSPLLMAFKTSNDTTVFQILRFMKIEVKGEIADDLPPTIPYQRPSRKSLRQAKGEIVDGVPPLQTKNSVLKMRDLDMYHVPRHLRYQINSKDEVEDVKNHIEVPLCWENYAPKLSKLLHIEECQMEVDIRRYDMHGVTLKREGPKFLKLRVLGLAENRPSVLKGDHLFARYTSDRSNSHPEQIKTYKGYVHRVEMEDVVLGFAREFLDRFTDGIKVDIEFTFNRLPLRLQHFAVEETPNHADLQKVLFPTSTGLGGRQPLCSVTDESLFARSLYDQKLASNTEQVKAVLHILQGTSRPAPYLVFGPPGTGKTVTMVEAIKQVYKHLPDSRILACAPSNSAADLIAKRLLTGTGISITVATNLFRMNALSREWKTVDQTLKEKECCNYNKMTGDNFFPAKEEIMQKRVLVTTLCTAGRLATAKGFPYDHFTHIFIDEAGHAVEPEAIISLSNLMNPNHPHGGQVVLAGDPKQLGPVLRSPLALEHGLELSLLERFMTKCELYKRTNEEPHYNSRVLTKLLRNYRSHPAILKLPNRLFYANELEVHADVVARESLCRWEKLPKKDFPIIFHGVQGLDEREGQSPSFFNKKEIEIVVSYAKDILEKRGGMRVKETDIGIISPYRRQVQKIKEVLRKHKMSDIKVGSVEEFQGQERLVIIVSTVRSTKPEHIQMDIDYKLGFVKNPKRLNVAVTRAKALLILVGNPYMLRKDINWNMFLEYCLENSAYKGCFFKPEEDEVEETIEKFEKLKITSELVDKPVDERLGTLGTSAVAEQHDPEWRSED
ncbi:putative helicase MOV-10 [Patiria miniata]|uniref:RNA helicase n=1 Tax=Patiria miniata TaxID=46514 RepID=A0A913ZSX3_PATMI|nr:putative helicase MOV-10 [Patiria miniata]